MKFLSVCSGIEAVSVATASLGWEAVGFSEIEPLPCSVLTERFPHVPNFGNMENFDEWNVPEFDILAGGTPCQSFSIAGLRGGLQDERGNLALVYCRILQKFRPKWFLWENVPGVLSSAGGRDFGSILGAMVELGYGVAYRVLDAQYFGVPQRRRRVFIVGCLGDWTSAAEVLFEPNCLRGDTTPSRKPKQEVAGTLGARTCRSVGTQDAEVGHLVAYDLLGKPATEVAKQTDIHTPLRARIPGQVENSTVTVIASTGNTAHCLNAGGMGRQDYETETMIVSAYRTAGDGAVYETENRTAALTTATDPSANIIAFQSKQSATAKAPSFDEVSPTLDVAKAGGVSVTTKTGVRRLTPIECERLQGFPDNWTLVNHRSKPAADGPRYKAIGNSMAVPVIRWICKRIQEKHACPPISTPEYLHLSSSTLGSPSTTNARQV